MRHDKIFMIIELQPERAAQRITEINEEICTTLH